MSPCPTTAALRSAATTSLLLCASLALVACLGAKTGSVADTTTADTATADTTTADTATADTATADTATADTGLPELPCECTGGEVYRHGPCVPTLDLGCGPACEGEADCDEHLECSACAASTSCGTRDCQPACAVPYRPHAPMIEPLRITPTHLAAGGSGPVTIEGTSYYIGALGHSIRLGDATLAEFGGFSGDGSCQASVDIPADTSPGAHPLWVSQYSGGEPWVLAGILYVGGAPPVCAQPGFPCSQPAHCCTAPGLTFACQGGRCRRP